MNPELQIKLTTMYNQPQRYYHNMSHVNHCLGEFEEYISSRSSSLSFEKEIEYTLWFHDVVYNPHSKINELNSAKFFDEVSTSSLCGPLDHSVVFALILGTQNHQVGSESLKEAHNIVNDIDYSILGQQQKVYLEYIQNIRKEYYFVEYQKFSKLRKQFLVDLLKHDRIYQTEYFHKKYEKKARANIAKEIDMLSV
ncbi:MAG: hypothetical protein AABY22_26905 [Nanoarchaeota archaeon]